jgi:hypothetical protein
MSNPRRDKALVEEAAVIVEAVYSLAVLWIEHHPGERLTVEALAAFAGDALSPIALGIDPARWRSMAKAALMLIDEPPEPPTVSP